MWIVIVVIIVGVGFFLYSGLASSQTTFRVITNQWVANKQLDDIQDEEIFDLILKSRYNIKGGAKFPQRHESIINEIKDDIKQGFSFLESYSLTLTLYTIFLIENNKEFINSEKYDCVEEMFEAISGVIKQQPKLEKYAGY